MIGKSNYAQSLQLLHTALPTLFVCLTLLCSVAFALASNASDDNKTTMPAEGTPAPDFALPSDDGRTIKLSDFKNKQTVVLYFYPKDETPGCTKEACAFRDNLAAFKQAGVEVLGVSVDTAEAHQQFKRNQKLNFTLLADDKMEVSKEYGVLGTYKQHPIAKRVTFIIGKDGLIKRVYPNVDPAIHATEVLAFAKSL